MTANPLRLRHVVRFAAFFPVTVISSHGAPIENSIGLVSELAAYQRVTN
jgi:hypothetical protein